MNDLLREAFEKASQLPENEQERLARLLLNEIKLEHPREGLDASAMNPPDMESLNGGHIELSEEKGKSVPSKLLGVTARCILTITDFAILQFMRTRAGERTIQPTKRRSYPNRTKQLLFERQRRRCVICGKAKTVKNFQVDHIVPVVRGGPDNVSNFQLLCPSCNQRKGIHTNQEFYERYKRVLSRNMLLSPPSPPPEEIAQKALKEETLRTFAHTSVQQFKRTKYISASAKIQSGSLTTGVVIGVGWFVGWSLIFPQGGDLVANVALFGGITAGLVVWAGIVWRARHTGMYEQ